MTRSLESTKTSTIEIVRSDDRFDQTSMVFHWLTVLLIVIQFASIWAHVAVGHHSSLAAPLLSLHRSAGVLIWFVTVMRLFWRHVFGYLPPFPPSMSKFQQIAAKTNEYGLYLMLLTLPVTGLARVMLRGQPFDLFFLHLPALLEPNPALRSIFVTAHGYSAKALMALIGLHVGAALFHRLVLRDGVLNRMLPRISLRTKLTLALAKK